MDVYSWNRFESILKFGVILFSAYENTTIFIALNVPGV